jgi:glycosyltransferase involved in cell wall biosynthesis
VKISLISTVKDAGPHIGEFLDSVAAQTRRPDEVVVVDGGSTDGTVETLRSTDWVTLIELPGANISAGRAAAISAATHDDIAVADADCVLDTEWLSRLERLLEAGADVAMGFYRPIADNLFEAYVAAVHLPEPEEVDEARFMPSSRSVAFTRSAYESAGGYPEWLAIGEDMYLNHRWRERGMDMRMDREAVVSWRVRPTLRATWRQYFAYARGDALAGMYPRRHALRFGAYAGIIVLAPFRFGRVLLLAGALLYAWRPLRRAFRRLAGRPAAQVGSLVAVPALIAFCDVAKMSGYLAGMLRRLSGHAAGPGADHS